MEAQLLAGARLAAHVDGGGGIVADQEHAQARAHAARGQGGHARAQLLADGASGGRAVEHPCAHAVTARMIAQGSPADGAPRAARSARAEVGRRRAGRRSRPRPSAPASTTERAFARVMPPMATSGRRRRRARPPHHLDADHGVGVLLGARREDGPDGHVVDRLRRRRRQLRRGRGSRRRAASPAPTTARASAAGRSSCPTCTPSAPTRRATSARSFTTRQAPEARAAASASRARATRRRSGRPFARSWMSRGSGAGQRVHHRRRRRGRAGAPTSTMG